MKHRETLRFSPEDIKTAILWLSREELNIPSDYKFMRDVDITIDAPYWLNNQGELEATLEWWEE
jgi:hypothetical protein